MTNKYDWAPYEPGQAPPTVTEILRPAPHRPRIDYRRVFAWRPVETENGRVWLRFVWKMSVIGDDSCSGYADDRLPIGWHR